nr:leucine-rich repeat domain-containing protein [uncultured Blautia sp.]
MEENSSFEYEKKGGHVVITALKGDPTVVEVPEVLDGLPVTELKEYLFSGKSLEILYLPDTVRKIGRYGFYNCRSLHTLSFGSNFADIGSGAFTGCHKIRKLYVHMDGQESGIKEILSEVGEELEVVLSGSVEAVLWFPEYYEEGVENTPARILMTQIHGSGLYYRNCFAGKQFNYQEYDKRFEMACAQENEKFLMELAFGRLKMPWELTDKARKQYEEYIQAHYEQLAELLIRNQRQDELAFLMETYPLDRSRKSVYDHILEMAGRAGDEGTVSMLMEYGRIHFPTGRPSFLL